MLPVFFSLNERQTLRLATLYSNTPPRMAAVRHPNATSSWCMRGMYPPCYTLQFAPFSH